jgi:hypothetical protein
MKLISGFEGFDTLPAIQGVPWHPHLRRFPIPVGCLKIMIYSICSRSILTIDTDNEAIHFSVQKGLTFICLCNLSFSSERISKFFGNPHIACRLWNQQMKIYSKNISIGTILVTISYPTEILTLLEISKIGFLKKGLFLLPKIKKFPIPIRNLYSQANIIDLKFRRYSHGLSQRIYRNLFGPDLYNLDSRDKWVGISPIIIRSCIKNCSKHGTRGHVPKCYYNGCYVFFSHRDWYEKGYIKGECHERPQPILTGP